MNKPAFTIQQSVEGHIAPTFEHFLNANLRLIFCSGLFFPGVAGVYPKGNWSRPGDQRIISLENGQRLVCSLEAVVRDKTLTYRIKGFTLLGRLIRAVDIRFVFEKKGSSATHVSVIAEFIPSGPAGGWFFDLFLLPLFKAYFKRALAAASQQQDSRVCRLKP